jgi:hypothetical protein
MPQAALTKDTLIAFCKEFVEHPYLCYTEHGLHARFLQQLHDAFGANNLLREDEFGGQRVGLLQKEYPTNRPFDRSRRQNWDAAVIRHPIVPIALSHPYDHLPLAAVVEFGLNYGAGHLLSDLERLSHDDAQVDAPMIAHLYRLSMAGAQNSKRDISPNSAAILPLARVCELSALFPKVTVYSGIADVTRDDGKCLWSISAGVSEQLI